MRCCRYYRYNWLLPIPGGDFLVDELGDELTDENGDFLIS